MFFETPRFPVTISYGATGGPAYKTEVVISSAGYESRNQSWGAALASYDVAHGLKNQVELSELLTFFRNAKGRAHSFRFKDWTDFNLIATESSLTLVSGSVSQYQTNKTYTINPETREIRIIRKPVPGTFALYESATLLTQGAGAGNYTVNTATGVVTLVAKQTRGVSTHVVGTGHIFTLASALSPNVTVGQKVSVSGVTGTAATLLNGLPLTVTVVSGADIAVSVNTTALTASGGTLSLFTQSDSLTASTEFDVPCRFDTDSMKVNIEFYNSYTWGQIPVIEVRT